MIFFASTKKNSCHIAQFKLVVYGVLGDREVGAP